jgi:hypothetical protein
LCNSCGGDYPTYGGGGTVTNINGNWLSFGDKCTGTLQEVDFIPKLCCSADKPPCYWCKSCGINYQLEIAKKFNNDYSNDY